VLVACAKDTRSGPVDAQADAGHTPTTTDAGQQSAATQVLCDGSDSIRFGYNVSGGGQVPDTVPFTIPYGFSGFFVDGTCHYYALSEAWQGEIVSGTLSSDDAKQLVDEVGWNELDRWRTYKDPGGCPDASGNLLIKPGAAVSCVCGCDEPAPQGIAQAFAAAERWRARLASAGAPIAGPVSALAVPNDSSRETPTAWPLTRSMASVPNLLFEAHDPKLGTGPYACFDDPNETMMLRALRGSAEHGSWSSSALMSDGGKTYDLYMRDELPDAAAHAINTLLASEAEQ
jgi:hypothetical protein